MKRQYDICIVGGGMAGASLACALAGLRARVAVLEAVPWRREDPPGYDDRGLALSLATRRVLQVIGVWSELEGAANPIRRIHVTEQGRFGRVCLGAAESGFDAFGHVVVARELGQALLRRAEAASNVEILCPARVLAVATGADAMQVSAGGEDGDGELHCRLLVIADGAASAVRDLLGIGVSRYEYHQTAIVANVTPTQDHGDTAFERFAPDGPLALLPLSGGRCVAVCAVATTGHQRYLEMADRDFLQYLEKRFGRRLGRLTRLGSRRAYPLARVIADQQIGPRFVLLGNAAHTLHPNGAQGFNLAVRDMAALAEQIMPVLNDDGDPGSAPLLEAYMESRRADQERILRFSHGLARVFSAHDPVCRVLRRAGILGAEFLPPLKHTLMRAGMGLYGTQPAWVRAGRNR